MNDSESDIATHPNDAFFKSVFSDPAYARAFFQGHRPAPVVSCIDWRTLTPLPTTCFFEWLGQTGPEVTVLLYDQLFRLCLVYAA